MKRVYAKCCGIDVHKKLIVACLLNGDKQEIKEFGTCTKNLLELTQWLKENGCEMVAMESTASYWKPIYNVLEAFEMNVMVVNARDMKAVPGRKTDVNDAQWIADLLQHGLLRGSYIPDKEQRELRELISYRQSLIRDRASELNRLQKMLEGANIKLSGTVANINGKSARNLIELLLKGKVIDEETIDNLYKENKISSNLKADKNRLIEDLQGVLSKIQIKMIKELLSHVDELSKHICNLDTDIDNFMNDEEKKASEAIKKLPGIGEKSAQAIIASIGTNMDRFPTDSHISSWAGLCPGNNESAGKRKSGRTRKGNNMLKSILVVCAHAAVKNKESYFSAQFSRISAHRGSKRAYVAVAHSMLIAIYHILKEKVDFKDLGSEYYNQFNRERKISAYLKKLKSLGCEIPDTVAGLTA